MESFENRLFRYVPTYQNKLIKRIVAIIRYGGRTERTIQGYKIYLFKMLEGVVRKNISNFLKLMSSVPYSPSDTMERDELISECYVILDTCIWKYIPSRTNNFYFYYNKALSRCFYRRYQRYSMRPHIEATEEMIIINPRMHVKANFDNIGILYHSLGFTELEIRISESRMLSQSMTEFVHKNRDVTFDEYRAAFASITEKMEPYLAELRTERDKDYE